MLDGVEDDEPHGEHTQDADPGFLNIPGRAFAYLNGLMLPRICRICGKRQLRFMPLAVQCWYCDRGQSDKPDALEEVYGVPDEPPSEDG